MLDEGKLRAYLDNELPEAGRKQVEAELAGSAGARAALAGLRREAAGIEPRLASLAPTSANLSPAPAAWRRFRARLAGPSISPVGTAERMKAMFTPTFLKRHQTAITALVLAALVATAFSFAPVRVVAGNLLKVFRVQEVKFVPVDVGRIESNEELAELLRQFSPDSEVVVDGGEPQEVGSLSEAASRVDFPVAGVSRVPGGAGQESKVLVQGRSVANIFIDKDVAESIFDAAGVEVSLPDSLSDTPVVITRPATVIQLWGAEEAPTLVFTQMRSPEIEYPNDLDLPAVVEAALQVGGMSEAEAKAFVASVDLSTTLLLPVPKDEGIELAEVSINGARGHVFRHPGEDEAAVLWQKDGLTYLLTGAFPAEQLLDAAKSVQ
ncbi:MAG: hypothetical protein ACE5H9_06340 [Anaerolineae bacterium]